MRPLELKKQFRLQCKLNIKAGLLNRPDGTWGNINTCADNAMKQHTPAGHAHGRNKRGHARHEKA